MGDQISILTGKVEYTSHNVDESSTSLKGSDLDFVAWIEIDIKHLKNDGHEIAVKVEQGYVKAKTKNHKVLTIESISHFKFAPYDEEFFKKPASTLLVNLFTDIAKIASAQNSGMFCIIREDYNMNDVQPQPIPKKELQNQIYNSINKYLFN